MNCESAKEQAGRVQGGRETMYALGELVAGVAHEVRNPLFGISALIDALDARRGRSDDQCEYIRALRGEVARLTDLARDLLEYGKPPVLALQPLRLEPVVRDALCACSVLAASRRVSFAASFDASLVQMDPRRLAQVFQNLAQNAVQHSAAGGVVEVRSASRGSRVVCTIDDRGPGFAQEDLGRLFEPFFSRRPGGTGLGLSIARRIVEQHGGSIRAQNAPGGGARVTIEMPAVEAQ